MNERGVLHFQLRGIPVSIYPISWFMLLLLGGGLGVDDGRQLAHVLLFVIAGMLCLLVHEMGHALTARHLTGWQPAISITGLGGVTDIARMPRTRAGYFAVVFAGPLASLLLGLVGGLIFGLHIGAPATGMVFSLLYPLPVQLSPELLMAVHAADLPRLLLSFYLQLFGVCMWWTIFNLLPIFPLDGGKLLGTLLNNNRIACIVGLVFGCALTALCLFWALLGGSWFNVVIVGYLTYINYSYLRQL